MSCMLENMYLTVKKKNTLRSGCRGLRPGGHGRAGVHLVHGAPEDAEARPRGRADGGHGPHARGVHRRLHGARPGR